MSLGSTEALRALGEVAGRVGERMRMGLLRSVIRTRLAGLRDTSSNAGREKTGLRMVIRVDASCFADSNIVFCADAEPCTKAS
jgi:hypothetical protein